MNLDLLGLLWKKKHAINCLARAVRFHVKKMRIFQDCSWISSEFSNQKFPNSTFRSFPDFFPLEKIIRFGSVWQKKLWTFNLRTHLCVHIQYIQAIHSQKRTCGFMHMNCSKLAVNASWLYANVYKNNANETHSHRNMQSPAVSGSESYGRWLSSQTLNFNTKVTVCQRRVFGIWYYFQQFQSEPK